MYQHATLAALARSRSQLLGSALALAAGALRAASDPYSGDPLRAFQWPELRREFLGGDAAALSFDPRDAAAHTGLRRGSAARAGQRVGRRHRRRRAHRAGRPQCDPQGARVRAAGRHVALGLRFKLEQASPVRVAARTRDGAWHVGSTWIESSGGGCSGAGATRKDGSSAQTLGQVSGRLLREFDAGATTRLRLRVMHPMDTGLVGGIPAFYLRRLEVRDAGGASLLRLATFEPVSENTVFSFGLAARPSAPLRVDGVDKNGNRVLGRV